MGKGLERKWLYEKEEKGMGEDGNMTAMLKRAFGKPMNGINGSYRVNG